MASEKPSKKNFQWGIKHVGSLDQVALNTAEELKNIDKLDPKMWIALSCPTKGLQFDARTLQLLDGDGDGRIRLQDVTEAVDWTVPLLRDPAVLTQRTPDLPLAEINDETPEGAFILKTARKLIAESDTPNAEAIKPALASQALTEAVNRPFNGDGVLPPYPQFGEEMAQFISDVMATVGSTPDASGKEGIDEALANEFFAQSDSLLAWQKTLDQEAAALPFGDATASAYAVYTAAAAKIDDYFIRCQLAAYDPAAGASMNAPEDVFKRLSEEELSVGDAALLKLPLEKVAADDQLSLKSGLNPAWIESIRALNAAVLTPLLGERDALSYADWTAVKKRLAPYQETFVKKPETGAAKLGLSRLQELDTQGVRDHFAALLQDDLAAKKEIESMRDIERLTLYHAHLYRFLMNFVSFGDFYDMKDPTTFQLGVLYLDSKNCNLCILVDNIEDHAAQAKLSGLCLAYCTCVRKNSTETMNIVAAVTAGNVDLLIPGRHGVFIDARGNEWDTTLVKLVANPINLREAVFSPYRRIARAIGTQIQKFSAAKDEKIMAAATNTINKAAEDPQKAASAAAAAPVDIGKNVGILAAIGLALGAIGTAVASIFSALVAMSWWQYPLILVGIFLIVSGPSVVLAWLKLRKRTLGPVLDASGWAVNSQIPVNLAMGDYLTGVVKLPANSIRVVTGPLRSHFKRNTILALLIIILAAACVFGGWYAFNRITAQPDAPAPQSEPAPQVEKPAPQK